VFILLLLGVCRKAESFVQNKFMYIYCVFHKNILRYIRVRAKLRGIQVIKYAEDGFSNKRSDAICLHWHVGILHTPSVAFTWSVVR
jgi:hypothetical protein